MNFVDFLFEKTDHLSQECVISREGILTYQDVLSCVDGLAAYLGETIGSGIEILLLSENNPFFIISYLAIIKSGNVALLVETQISDEQLATIVQDCRIGAFFIQEKFRSKLKEHTNVFTEDFLSTLPGSKKFEIPSINEKDVAVVIFTSGSTGAKKGVMLTHRNLCANTESIVQYLNLTSRDRICATLPLFYCYGASLLHTHLRVGGSILLSNNIFLGGVIHDINTYQCTGFAGVPSTYQILVNKTPFLKESFPTLRYMTQAGGQLPNSYIRMVVEAFSEKQVYVMYGATEATARLSYLPPHLVLTKMGSIGKGIPGVHLAVVDDSGNPTKPHETGEIIASGDNIMLGYYGDPEGTQEILKKGWLYTGDLATVDEDGYIYIVGRAKNIIKSGGYRISPNEIENLICSLEGVVGCTVIGLPDDIMGEAVTAVVQPDTTPHEKLREKIISICTRTLPSYKIPREIFFIKDFPLNSSDKIDKLALLAKILSIRERDGGVVQ